MRILFACGGTGGHINPALAVARLVKEKRPNAEILFVGVRGGMEERLVPASGFEIKTVSSCAFSRKKSIASFFENILIPKKIITSEREAKKIIEDFSPDAVMGTGGYACYPVLSVASRMGIPTLIHEANAFPGLACRVLAKRLTKLLLNFEVSRKRLSPKVSCKVVGMPVRGDILMYDREKARRELGVEDKPLLVSFWGSLGAREMNKHIAEVMRFEKENEGEFYHIHATGRFGYSWMPDFLAEKGIDFTSDKHIKLREYIDDMPRVLAAADVVMCRGGAGTLSEILARGVPAIIVPSPNVTDNHQYKNAIELEKIGGAIVIEEKDVTPRLLYDTVRALLRDEKRRKAMSGNLVENAVLDGTERIYREIVEVIKK